MKTRLWFWLSSKTMEYLLLALCTPLNEPEVIATWVHFCCKSSMKPEFFSHQSWTGRTWVKVNRENVEAQITAPLFMGIWYMNLSLETSREFLMLLTCVSALIIVEETSHNEPQRPYCRKLEVGEISFTRNVWYRMIHQEYHQGCTEFLYRPLVRNIFASQKLKVYIDVKPPAKPKYLVQNALLWVVPLQFLQFF